MRWKQPRQALEVAGATAVLERRACSADELIKFLRQVVGKKAATADPEEEEAIVAEAEDETEEDA